MIFVSHRHEDRAIADVFRESFRDWSNGQVSVFQSSDAESSPRIGDPLDESISNAVAKAQLVLLVYTGEDEDWSWCMYECGLAHNPRGLQTRLVVFHTTEQPPGPLRHLVTVPMKEQTVQTLADDFHRDPMFFPGLDRALVPVLEDDRIKERGNELYRRLLNVAGGGRSRTRQRQRYDSITFAMPLDEVNRVAASEASMGYKQAFKTAGQMVAAGCTIRKIHGEPQVHFSFEEVPVDLKFQDLVDRWKSESEYGETGWDEELRNEMVRAILNRREGVLSLPLNSLMPGSDQWFLPVLVGTRILPGEGWMEFDVHLCGIDPTAAMRMISEN